MSKLVPPKDSPGSYVATPEVLRKQIGEQSPDLSDVEKLVPYAGPGAGFPHDLPASAPEEAGNRVPPPDERVAIDGLPNDKSAEGTFEIMDRLPAAGFDQPVKP